MEKLSKKPPKELAKEPVQMTKHQNSQADNLDTNELLPSDRSVTNIPQTTTQTNQDFHKCIKIQFIHPWNQWRK